MKAFLTFQGYGVNSTETTVAVGRITHFESINYNGNSGTRLYLDTGKEVTVSEPCFRVESMLTEALKP